MHALIAVVTLLPTIWIVDAANGPGTNFTDLPQAVAAATSGDTIIVKAGAYTCFDVSGKALTILGAGAASTVVSLPGIFGPQTGIHAVPAGTTFYVSGLRFAPQGLAFYDPSSSLFVHNCPGTVVLSGVIVVGIYTAASVPVTRGLSIWNSRLYASRCTFTGGLGPGVFYGSDGAFVWAGVLVADDSTFQGGTAVNGGAGVFISSGAQSGFATLTRCSAAGGSGSGSGGSGVHVYGGSLRAAGTSANVFTGAVGGQGYNGFAVAATPGYAAAILHGNITLVPGAGNPPTSGPVTTGPALPYLSISGTPTIGGDLSAIQPVTMTLDGVLPLAPFVLALDFAPGFSSAYASLLLGELLVGMPPSFLFEGSLDASGQLQVTGTPAAVSPALVGIPFYAQFGVLDAAASNVRMSNGLVRRFQ